MNHKNLRIGETVSLNNRLYKIEDSPYSNGWKQGRRAVLKLVKKEYFENAPNEIIFSYCNKCDKKMTHKEMNDSEIRELEKEGSFVCSECINKEMNIPRLKSRISELNLQEDKQMDKETIRELVSLKKKGILTEQELFDKLLNENVCNETIPRRQYTKRIETDEKSEDHPRLWRNHKAWTEKEIERLVTMKGRQYSFRAIGKTIGRKSKACKMRYNWLIESGKVTPPMKKVRGHRGRTWTQTEADALIKNYGKMPDEEIAKALNRTSTAIMHKASKMKLAKANPRKVGRPRKDAKDTVQVGEFGFPKKFTVNP